MTKKRANAGAFKKGEKRPGQGRPKGLPNKATANAREAIGRFVDSNASRMQAWLDEVAKESPEKAFNMLKDVIEYHVPKLGRTDITSGGKALPPNVIINV